MNSNAPELIIGGSGQDGYYLSREILKNQKSTILFDLVPPKFQCGKNIHFVRGNLNEFSSIRNLIDSHGITHIYNLASLSSVMQCESEPENSYKVNYEFVSKLIDDLSLIQTRKNIKFFQASSSEMFGNSATRVCNEASDFSPLSIYGQHKFLAHQEVSKARKHGMYASTAILFNHESPLRDYKFVSKKITSGVFKVLSNELSKIRLGNLHAQRDWGFAGDYAKAIYKINHLEHPDDFVIGSGFNHSVLDFCKMAFHFVGIDNFTEYIEEDDLFKREKEENYVVADYTLAKKTFAWAPKLDFTNLVRLLMRTEKFFSFKKNI